MRIGSLDKGRRIPQQAEAAEHHRLYEKERCSRDEMPTLWIDDPYAALTKSFCIERLACRSCIQSSAWVLVTGHSFHTWHSDLRRSAAQSPVTAKK
jgi:ABC-type thiamine transport system ATPase subunit